MDDEDWVFAASHLHTSVGGDHSWHRGMSYVMKLAAKKGIDFAIVTDHNTIDHWSFPEFAPRDASVPARGEEWTSKEGHASLLIFDPQGGPIVPCEEGGRDCEVGPEDYRRMVDETHRRGGLVMINHPVLSGHLWPADTFGADGEEINHNLTDRWGRKGRAWWHERLVLGQRLVGWGGSDFHYFFADWLAKNEVSGDGEFVRERHPDCSSIPNIPPGHEPTDPETMAWPIPTFSSPVNLIHVSSRSVEGLKEAIAAGRVLVLQKLDSPQCFIGLDSDGDGVFDDAREGDVVSASSLRELRFQARVMGGDGEVLRIIDADGETAVPVEGDDFVHAFTRAAGAGHGFVRLELGTRGACAGNPIYW